MYVCLILASHIQHCLILLYGIHTFSAAHEGCDDAECVLPIKISINPSSVVTCRLSGFYRQCVWGGGGRGNKEASYFICRSLPMSSTFEQRIFSLILFSTPH